MGVGEALATAREASGQTIDDVSRATRIRGEVLRRIEQDDFEACGGTVYARGHIRSIATYIGLDPAVILAEFDRQHGAPEAPGAREIFEHEVVAMPERTGPNWTAAMAVMAGVLLVVALVSLFNSNPAADRGVSALPLSTGSPTPPAAPVTPKAEPPATPGPLAGHVPGNGVAMRLAIVNTKSWVTVRSDGKIVYQGLLTMGDRKDFTAKRLINVVLGNAGAVRLVVNGRDLGTPGKQGDVVRLDFTPGDPGAAG